MNVLWWIIDMFNFFGNINEQYKNKKSQYDRNWYIMEVDSRIFFSGRYRFIIYNPTTKRAFPDRCVKAKRCPGFLAGVICKSGKADLNMWLRHHPKWQEEFGNVKIKTMLKG